MKKLFILAFTLILSTSFLHAQKWSYSHYETPFEGKAKAAYITGVGGKFPYQTPQLSINIFDYAPTKLNMYLTDAGYAGCENNMLYIRFKGEDKIYTCKITTNSEKDTWYFTTNFSDDSPHIRTYDLLVKMKTYSKMYIRASSSCQEYDYEFPLTASTAAINFVAGDYLKKMEEVYQRKKPNSLERINNLTIKEFLSEIIRETKCYDISNTQNEKDRVIIYKLPDYYNLTLLEREVNAVKNMYPNISQTIDWRNNEESSMMVTEYLSGEMSFVLKYDEANNRLYIAW